MCTCKLAGSLVWSRHKGPWQICFGRTGDENAFTGFQTQRQCFIMSLAKKIAVFLPLRSYRSVAFNIAAVSIKSERRDGLHESFVTSGEYTHGFGPWQKARSNFSRFWRLNNGWVAVVFPALPRQLQCKYGQWANVVSLCRPSRFCFAREKKKKTLLGITSIGLM